jgi:hypothetical protein
LTFTKVKLQATETHFREEAVTTFSLFTAREEKTMSWDEIYRGRKPCPCGKGEYEEVHRENDWFQYETRRDMLCPECKERYSYSEEIIGGHPGDEIERGWVLKNVLEAEHSYREQVMARTRELCFMQWQQRFEGARTKKQVWEIFTMQGKYYPALGTFYQHTKGYDRTRLMAYVDHAFDYFHDLDRIWAVCSRIPDWEALGIVTGGTCEMCGSQMVGGVKEWKCSQCRYRRPDLTRSLSG